MKKKIAILGSTGSIGKSTLDIIKKNPNDFDVVLITAKNNHTLLYKQAIKFKAKNIIIFNEKKYSILKKKLKNKKTKIYRNFFDYSIKNKKNKIDYTMCSISGLHGLKPILNAIKFSKKIAIANKESIICGWNLINKELKKHNTDFVPVDSEHFSIWRLTEDTNNKNIKKIILTASGGPFFNTKKSKIKNVKPVDAIKHPNWKMGKKISVDSSTLMNKVFEVIEAYKIFNFDPKKFEVFIHPQSYVHAIVQFNNGLTKQLIHDTDMKIPIINSLSNPNANLNIKSSNIDPMKLSKLEFYPVDSSKFPVINFLKLVPKNNTLFETVIVSANDTLVNLFLNNKIKYNDIYKNLNKVLKVKKFIKLKKKKPYNVDTIYKIYEMVRLKTISLSV
tara:strand:- start:586 stop:1755 length:1170 start_codon:yes stop_codon:yes gene_type:complete